MCVCTCTWTAHAANIYLIVYSRLYLSLPPPTCDQNRFSFVFMQRWYYATEWPTLHLAARSAHCSVKVRVFFFFARFTRKKRTYCFYRRIARIYDVINLKIAASNFCLFFALVEIFFSSRFDGKKSKSVWNRRPLDRKWCTGENRAHIEIEIAHPVVKVTD